MQSGGTERVVSLLANDMVVRGHEVHLITFSPIEEIPFFAVHPGIIHHPLGLFGGGSRLLGPVRKIKRLLKIRKTFLKISPRLVLSFGDKTNVIAVLAGMGLNLPVIVSERTNPEKQALTNGRYWSWIIKKSYRWADHVIFQSEGAAEYFISRGISNYSIIPNPVLPPPKIFSHSDANSTHTKRVIGVGRFSREKGFDLLIKAFSQVAGQFPEWQMVIFGDGPLRGEMENMVVALNLGNRISLPGTTADIARELTSTDLFILPSRHEGFPNALCEAMASGVPVIAADCPFGPSEIISHGKNGLLVSSEDSLALAERMAELMANPERRLIMGENAGKIVTRFGIEEISARWERMIHEVLS